MLHRPELELSDARATGAELELSDARATGAELERSDARTTGRAGAVRRGRPPGRAGAVRRARTTGLSWSRPTHATEAEEDAATMAAVLERATCPSWRCRTRAPPSALAGGAC
ncbi:hypothetical protein [Stigmatella aurantiaca]|uniref:hypothetical protein n=1 Tax=Stigmatella aurantiaca TaxID=41 RepID=UPI000A8BF617|nr:hypothetical protein [Stigmatella aurantiaca]